MSRPPAPLPLREPMTDRPLWLAWDHGYALGLHDGWERGWNDHQADIAARHAAIARRIRETAQSPDAAELARRRGQEHRAAYLQALAIVRGYHPTAPSILEGPWPPMPDTEPDNGHRRPRHEPEHEHGHDERGAA